jgi:hypothetical protein
LFQAAFSLGLPTFNFGGTAQPFGAYKKQGIALFLFSIF